MLRRGNANDFDALYPIYMDPSINPYLSFEILDKKDFLPIFNELTLCGDLYVYEHVDNGDLLATCVVNRGHRRCSHIVCLTTLATNPNYHRQGFGSKFVRALINHLREDPEIKRIELYAEADNLTALNFYKKIGFEVEGCLKKYHKRATENHYVDELVLGMVFD